MRHHLLAVLLSVMSLLCFQHNSWGETASSITYDNVTFSFSDNVTIGTFATGDYWVVAPVTVTAISPAYEVVGGRLSNGWEVNPVGGTTQGFQEGCKAAFDSEKVPSLPYVASAGDSIVKSTVSTRETFDDEFCLDKIVVLTVLAEAPANPSGTFRPPYVGTTKPQYLVANIRSDLLPSLAPVGSPPDLSTVAAYFDRPQMDHINGAGNRSTRPAYNMPHDYQPTIMRYYSEAILRIMLAGDSYEAKLPTIVSLLQYGIDQYYATLTGTTWAPGSGHQPGHVLIMSFFALLLGDDIVKSTIASYDSSFPIHEKYYIQASTLNANAGLFGEAYGSEKNWWKLYVDQTGTTNHERYDPYKYIDGGASLTKDNNGYLQLFIPSWKTTVLAQTLMPGLSSIVNAPLLTEFVNRYTTTGTWYSPDPCAPVPDAIIVSAITTGNPTTLVSVGHGLVNGDTVRCFDFAGTDAADLNAADMTEYFTVTKIDDDNFTIDLNSSGKTITIGTDTSGSPFNPVTTYSRCYSGYGVTWGEDVDDDPAECILDGNLTAYSSPTDFTCGSGKTCGRYPSRHGTNVNAYFAAYTTNFTEAMWNAYQDYTSSAFPQVTGSFGGNLR